MARGQRRSIDEKIQQKEEMIEKLRARLKTEEDELENLLRQKKEEYYKNIVDMLLEANMSESEASEAIHKYLQNRAEPLAI